MGALASEGAGKNSSRNNAQKRPDKQQITFKRLFKSESSIPPPGNCWFSIFYITTSSRVKHFQQLAIYVVAGVKEKGIGFKGSGSGSSKKSDELYR